MASLMSDRFISFIVEGNKHGDVYVADAMATVNPEGILLQMRRNALQSSPSLGFVTGIVKRYLPGIGFLLVHIHQVIGDIESNMGHLNELVGEIFLDYIAFLAATDQEVVDSVVGIG